MTLRVVHDEKSERCLQVCNAFLNSPQARALCAVLPEGCELAIVVGANVGEQVAWSVCYRGTRNITLRAKMLKGAFNHALETLRSEVPSP